MVIAQQQVYIPNFFCYTDIYIIYNTLNVNLL
jgi:hypothetical protein